MSNAPSPGWPPPAVPRPSALWQVLQSWWLLLPVLGCSCLGGFGFIYVGLRAGRAAWWVPGIVYSVLGWTTFIIVGETDKESTVSDWAVGALLAVWIAGIMHASLINSAWLRWLADRQARTAAARSGAYPLAPLPRAAPAGPLPTPYPGMSCPSGALTAYPPASPTGYPPASHTGYPPGSPAHPSPSGYPSPAYPFGAPAYPPAPPSYPPGSPGGQPNAPVGRPPLPADPTMAPYQPVDSLGSEPLAPPSDPWADGESGRVDVNTAGPEALAALPGFDPQRVRQVLAERERRGSFGSLAEFAAAANLAPHEYARLRDSLDCVPPAGPAPGQPPPGRVLDV
ncbi:helix-hairpin-helix domain-containing protein [Micromonospora sp. NPDC049051]|uniref:ComEA family DNA-binding protein n=1 Tax=Micromonospora sp. NPDC049051 TaxID=3364264 RepID=UPI00371FC180